MLLRRTPSTLSTTTPTAAACHNCFSPLRPRLRGQGDQLLHRVGGLRPLGDPRPRLLAIDGHLRRVPDRGVVSQPLAEPPLPRGPRVGRGHPLAPPLVGPLAPQAQGDCHGLTPPPAENRPRPSAS